MNIPKFTGSDLKIMFGILIPYVILLNFILYGAALFSGPYVFTVLVLVSLLIKAVFWQFHTLVAVSLRQRYPANAQIMKRIGVSLLCFYLMTAVANSAITFLYSTTGFLGFRFELQNYLWVLLSGIVLNTFTTLVHEGVSTLEKWKETLTDTEQLRTEYAKSRLEGLKSQIKPHFLFNSINTLSALIGEDAKRAETFLDEVCKVYRYLLRNHGAYVPLSDELEFIHSYFYILKARFGEGLQVDISVSPEHMACGIPPFTLQLLMENIIQANVISKKEPLYISLCSSGNCEITLINSITRKINNSLDADESPLLNLSNKFRLLGLEELSLTEQQGKRKIVIPLVWQQPLERYAYI